MKIPDGNSAALRKHESHEAAAGERWDTYGDRVIDGIVDDILSGHGVKVGSGRTMIAADFMDEDWLDVEDMGNLLTGGELTRDRLRKRLAEVVREWCEESATGQDLVNDRINDLCEDGA